MLKKNDLLRKGDSFIRVLEAVGPDLLIIRSDSKGMPQWISEKNLSGYESCAEEDLHIRSYEELSTVERRIAHRRFTMIAPLLSVISDTDRRKRTFASVADQNNVSPQTVKDYLHKYLLAQDIAVLAPEKRITERALTPDEKKMRWALNKWFYSWEKHSLQTTNENMLKEKYCDAEGRLLPEYPTIHQFRYFYRKTKSLRKYVISREGIKAYQRDYRPLLGDGVQEYCSMVGYGMLDATVCDIYLVNEAGQIANDFERTYRDILKGCEAPYQHLA